MRAPVSIETCSEPNEDASRPAAIRAAAPAPKARTATSRATDEASGTFATSAGVSAKKYAVFASR